MGIIFVCVMISPIVEQIFSNRALLHLVNPHKFTEGRGRRN